MKRRIIFAIITLGVIAAVFIFTGTRGRMARFSPDTLEFQTQSEFTIFYGGLQVYQSGYETTENKLGSYLKQSGLVDVSDRPSDHWITMFHWNEAWRDGDSLLYKYVIRGNAAEDIIQRSKANPELAKIYWPEGFKYLRSKDEADQWAGLEILRRGWECETIEKLKEEIAKIIAERDREKALGTFRS